MPQEKTDTLKDSISVKETLIEKTENELKELRDEVSQLEKESAQFFNKKKEIISKKEALSRGKVELETKSQEVARREAEIKAEERVIEERERRESDLEKKREIEKKRWQIEDKRRVVEDERWEWDQKIEEVENKIRIVEEELSSEDRLNEEAELRKKQVYQLINRKEEELNSLRDEVSQLKEKNEEITSRKEDLKAAEDERKRIERERMTRTDLVYEEAVFDYKSGLYDSAEEKFKEVVVLSGPYEKVGFFKSIFKEKPIPQKSNEYLKKIARIKLKRRKMMEREDLKRKKDEEMFPQTKILYIRISEIKAQRRDVEEKIKRVLLNRSSLLVVEKEHTDRVEELNKKITSLQEKERELQNKLESATDNEKSILEAEREEINSEREEAERELMLVNEDLTKTKADFEENEKERSSLERKLGELTVEIEDNKEKIEEIKKEVKKEDPKKSSSLIEELKKETAALYSEALTHYKIGELDLAEQKFRDVIKLHGPFEEVNFPLSIFKEKPLPQKAEKYLKEVLKAKKEREKKREEEKREAALREIYEDAVKKYEEGEIEAALKQMRSLQNKVGSVGTLAAEFVKKIEDEIKEEAVEIPTEENTEEVEESVETEKEEASPEKAEEVETKEDVLETPPEEIKEENIENIEKEEVVEVPKEEATEEEVEKEAYADLYKEAEERYKEEDFETALEQFRAVKEDAEGDLPSLATEYIEKIEKELKEKELQRLYSEAEQTYKEGDLSNALQQFLDIEKDAEGELADLTTEYINKIEEELKSKEEAVETPTEENTEEAPLEKTEEVEETEEVTEEDVEKEVYSDLYKEAEEKYNKGELEGALEQFKTIKESAEGELADLTTEYINKIEEELKEPDEEEATEEATEEEDYSEERIISLYEEALADYEAGKLKLAEEKFSEVIRISGGFKDMGFLKSLLKKKSVAQKAEEYLNEINELKRKEREEERLIIEEIRNKAVNREGYNTEEGRRKKTLRELFEQAELNYKQGKLDTALEQFRYLEKEEDDISVLATEYIKKVEERKAKEEEWEKDEGVVGRKKKKIRKVEEKEEKKKREAEMAEYKRRLVMENFKEDYDEEEEVKETEDGVEEKEEKEETTTKLSIFSRVKAYLQRSRVFRVLFTFTRRHTTVAIDISDFSVEVLHLNQQKIVLAYARSLVDGGVIDNGEIADKEKLKEVIEYTLKITKPVSLEASKRKRMKAIITLPGSKMFVRQFKFDKEESVMENIKNQMKLTIPIPLEDLYFDHHFISSPNDKDINVLCVATEKKLVDSYMNILKEVGVDPIAFDIESAAIGRALITEREEGEEERNEMVVDLGATKSVLSVFQSGVLAFSVNLKIGGSYLTERVVKELNISFKEAERKKKDTGVSGKLHSALSKELDKIVMEMKEAEMYYEREFNKKIDKIILAGGTALLPGIISYLEDALERRVVMGDPLNKIRGTKSLRQKDAILYANVIGLALRGIDKDPVRGSINLLPESIKTREFRLQQEEKRPVIIIAVSLAIIGLIALAITMYMLYIH